MRLAREMRLFTLPSKRLARLLKNNAKFMRELEERAKVSVRVKKETRADANLEIEGDAEGEWVAEQVLRAVDIGFDPKIAFKLFSDNVYMEVMDLGLLLRRNERAISRYKARIIGTEGKARKSLEELSEAYIAVSDDERVGILGEFDSVRAAKEGITRILEGSPHGTVFAYLREESLRRNARAMGATL